MVYTPTSYNNLQGALFLWYTKANAGSAGATELTQANTYNGDGTGFDYQGNPNTWNVTAVTDMKNLFKNIINIGNYNVHPEINGWDVSNVTTMYGMFRNVATFNQDIGQWNVSQVTTMYGMFYDAHAFNQDIGQWNVSQVTDMRFMFNDARAFNQNIGQWNVSKVERMNGMFSSAGAFNGDISTKEITAENSPTGVAYTAWNVSQVTIIYSMFRNAGAFNVDISSWNVSQMTDMRFMFQGAGNFNQNINKWEVGSGTTLTNMFLSSGMVGNSYGLTTPTPLYTEFNQVQAYTPTDFSDLQGALSLWYTKANAGSAGATELTAANTYNGDGTGSDYQGNPTTWDVTAVTDMKNLFRTISNIGSYNVHPEINGWDVSNVTTMYGMFQNTTFNQPIGSWNVGNVTNMYSMFAGAGAFNQDIGQWNVSQVTDMRFMFTNAVAFNQDIGQWDVSQVTTMQSMFYNAAAFNGNISTKEITAENSPTGVAYTAWNVSQVTNMTYMFYNAAAFNQDIGQWNVSQVTNMSRMFQGAAAFNQNINRWAVGSGTTLTYMFLSSGMVGNSYGLTTPTPLYTEFNQVYTPTDFSDLQGALSLWYTKANAGSAGATELTAANTYNGDGTGSDYQGNPNTWDVTAVTDMKNLFRTISNIGSYNVHPEINGWDVSNVTTMNSMFYNVGTFNQDIGQWIVSQVTDMGFMFTNAAAFNQDIGQWDVSQVTTMNSMFYNGADFNQDIGQWNVSQVTTMESMFFGAAAFNQAIGQWNVSQVTTMSRMFQGAAAFNQNINRWAVGSGTTLTYMFSSSGMVGNSYGLTTPTPLYTEFNQPYTPETFNDLQDALTLWYQKANAGSAGATELAQANTYNGSEYYGNPTTWDVTAVTNMKNLFKNISNIGSYNVHPEINGWDVSNVTTMNSMFYNVGTFNQDIGQWNVSLVTNMNSMFYNAAAFNQDIGQWNVSKVTNMNSMFYNGAAFNQDIGQWNVSQVTTMNSMFYNAGVFNGDISTKEITAENSPTGVAYTAWNVSQVRTMNSMFYNAAAFKQDIGQWNVSQVTNMNSMFYNAAAFNQDIGQWNVSQVTNMNSMFYNGAAFNQDIGQWNVSQVTNMRIMFNGATAFNQNINVWKVGSGTTLTNMFANTGITSSNSYGFTVPTPLYTQFNQDIGIKGANPVTIEIGSTYVDSGAVAASDVTNLQTSNQVVSNIVGVYTVTYSGLKGSNTVTATRTVNVVDTTNPIITSNLLSEIDDGTTSLGSVVANETVTWSVDDNDIQIDSYGTVSLKTAANFIIKSSYNYTITAKDGSNNIKTISQEVNVIQRSPYLSSLNNALLSSVRASPAKDSTSNGSSGFARMRLSFARTHSTAVNPKKGIQGNKDASEVTRVRAINSNSRTLNASNTDMRYTGGNDANVVRNALQRTRRSGGVPNKVSKLGPFS